MHLNTIAIVLLATLVLKFAVETAAELLNMRASKAAPPPSLADIYKPADYAKSQAYLRSATRFRLVQQAFDLAVMLAFWLAGGFNWLDGVVRGWGFVPIVTGLFYIGLLSLAYGVLTLPFGIYETFVIEQRFGFNRTTPRTFVSDLMKGLLLGVLLGGAVLAALLALFQYVSTYAWLYAWAAAAVFVLLMQLITPTLIMPLFNKFTPMPPGELKDAILKYAASAGFPVKNISVMDGSRRSTRSNAFFTGFGRSRRIALFDTLIAQHTVPEMVTILAHEVGHYKKRHIIQSTVLSILEMGLIMLLLSVIVHSTAMYSAFFLQVTSVYAGMVILVFIYPLVDFVLSAGMMAFSRMHETEADRFAAKTTADPASMASALKKLASTNLSNLTPHPFYVFLTYSHPPMAQRLKTVQEVAAQK
jgi:STE24 endopeptidase